MSAASEKRQGLSDLLLQLDKGSMQDEEEFEEMFLDELRSARDSWLVDGVVDHYLRTQSQYALKLLLRLPETHCTVRHVIAPKSIKHLLEDFEI